MRELNLINGINTCIKTNKNTPRVALSLNFSILKPEKLAGEYLLMNRLLMKGTKKYSSEELSTVLDENAILGVFAFFFTQVFIPLFKLNSLII